MGLVIKKIFSYSLIILVCICVWSVCVFAGYSAPQEVIQGTWGTGDNQFGITYQDTESFIPHFDVTSSQKIVVRDGANGRVKIYSYSGTLESVVPYKANLDYKDLTIADSFGFSGDFIGYGTGGISYFYRADQKVYVSFTPTGQLIKTFTTRPLELGKVKSMRENIDGTSSTVVEFNDTTYNIRAPRLLEYFSRDISGGFYGAIKTGLGGQQFYRIYKYNRCGKEIGSVNLLPNIIEEINEIGRPTPEINVVEEYGKPVIAPNGDVYTWKRTPTNYSILKWTWVDDPNAPSGPDAPSSLTVTPSTTVLYLTWIASPSDPGCVTSYEISRATSAGGVGTTVGTVNAGTVKYNDTTASAGTTYYYKIRAVAGNEYSNYTAEVSGKK